MQKTDIIGAFLSNAAKSLDKQQRGITAELLRTMENSLPVNGSPAIPASFDDIGAGCEDQLQNRYPQLFENARAESDRGVLRALTWGEKVTKIQKSLLTRYQKQGDALLEGKQLHVCEACGFIAIDDAVPAICPICKAPASRFSTETGKEVS